MGIQTSFYLEWGETKVSMEREVAKSLVTLWREEKELNHEEGEGGEGEG